MNKMAQRKGDRGGTYQDDAVPEVGGDTSVAAAEYRLNFHVTRGPDSRTNGKADGRDDRPEGSDEEGESVTDQTGNEGEQGSARSDKDQPERSLNHKIQGDDCQHSYSTLWQTTWC